MFSSDRAVKTTEFWCKRRRQPSHLRGVHKDIPEPTFSTLPWYVPREQPRPPDLGALGWLPRVGLRGEDQSYTLKTATEKIKQSHKIPLFEGSFWKSYKVPGQGLGDFKVCVALNYFGLSHGKWSKGGLLKLLKSICFQSNYWHGVWKWEADPKENHCWKKKGRVRRREWARD